MEPTFRPFRTGSDADLAFAVVVLASYFTTFSNMTTTNTLELLLMIALGMAYISVGIYGYALAARSGKRGMHLVYFASQLTLGGMIVMLGRGAGYNALVLLPLAGHSVMLLPNSWRLAINLLLIGVYGVALEVSTGDWGLVWNGLPIFLAGQIFIVVFTQMAVSEEKARSEVEGLVKELEVVNQRLREYAMQADELATTRERNRLAREIHDGLGHYLTTIFMQLQAARAVMKTNPVRAGEAMGTAQNMTQEALADVRRSVSALRDHPGPSGELMEEIDRMMKSCDTANLSTQMKVIGGERPLPPPVVLTIYRAVQEGINNTCKHARATTLTVLLDYTHASQVRLSIIDDGVGASSVDGGFGLLGMRERVMLLNGTFAIETQPEHGFRLEICLPG